MAIRSKSTKVVLSFSANLEEDEVEDAICFIQLDVKDNRSMVWKECGQSNTLQMSTYLEWNKEFELCFQFQTNQFMKISFFKYSDSEPVIIAQASSDLQKIATSQNSEVDIISLKNKKIGTFSIKCAEDKGNREKILFQLAGEGLTDMDYFDKSDPYFRIFRKSNNSWLFVCESEVVDNNLNPNWKRIIMKNSEFSENNPENLMKIECFDYDTKSKSDYIGRHIFKAKDLVKNNRFPLVNEIEHNKPGGFIVVKEAQVIQESSFLDYLSAGMQFNLTVAIDFTSSNGLPDQSNSLHFFSQEKESEYAQAIRSIGQVLAKYDSDGKIAVYGFGGRPDWFLDGRVKNDFSLTKNEVERFVSSFDELIEVYKDCLNHIELAGPTVFLPLLNKAFDEMKKEENDYNILIILTDGDINDYDDTVDKIVEISDKPLSIIIIGIGYENFLMMKKLDGDQKVLGSKKGLECARDIVQFIRFRDFRHELAYFAEKVLEEIPTQVIQFKDLTR